VKLGSVNQLRQEASGAVVEAVAAAQTYVQQQSVGMDETSFVQQPRWSQSAAAPRLVVGDGDPVGELLHVWLSRSQATAQSLLGQGLREFSPVTVIVLTTG